MKLQAQYRDNPHHNVCRQKQVECYMLLMPWDPARTSSRIVSLSPFESSVDSTTVYLQRGCQISAKLLYKGFTSSDQKLEQTASALATCMQQG